MTTTHLRLEIECGQVACGEDGKLCKHVLTKKFGSIFICGLFREEDGTDIVLKDVGWLVRCDQCLAAQIPPSSSNWDLRGRRVQLKSADKREGIIHSWYDKDETHRKFCVKFPEGLEVFPNSELKWIFFRS